MIARKVGLVVKKTEQIEVRVATGKRIAGEGLVQNVHLHMQGHYFNTDFFLLPLGGCDVVVGMQWLRTLGLVIWDFNSLTMTFEHAKNSVTLQGLGSSMFEIVKGVQICQLNIVERKGMLLLIA